MITATSITHADLVSARVGTEIRIHAATCKDVAKDVRRSGRNTDAFAAGTTWQKMAETWMGDVATDTTDEDTPEWKDECVALFEMEAVVLPCAEKHIH